MPASDGKNGFLFYLHIKVCRKIAFWARITDSVDYFTFFWVSGRNYHGPVLFGHKNVCLRNLRCILHCRILALDPKTTLNPQP